MEKQVEVHAYHGWGFDAAFWIPFKNKLAEHILLKPADRGYYGSSFEPEFRPEIKTKVLFLHSYGVHWCSPEKIEQADLIVVFNGFDNFHPLKNPDKSRSKKTLKMMEKQFNLAPKTVLHAFYKNCYGDYAISHPNLNWINESLLKKDLSALHGVKFKLPKGAKAEWLLIDSAKDQIVPGSRGGDFLKHLNSATYEVVQNGTHSLPFSNSEQCIEILNRTFPIFDSNG